MITPAHIVAHVFAEQTIHHTTYAEAGVPVTACGKPVATLPDGHTSLSQWHYTGCPACLAEKPPY